MVMIGIDPHKGSHTAVVLDRNEVELAPVDGSRRARQTATGCCRWRRAVRARVWAVESAGGLGYLLAEQLVAAGEQVVDVPATLSARARLLGTGRRHKERPERRSVDGDRGVASP